MGNSDAKWSLRCALQRLRRSDAPTPAQREAGNYTKGHCRIHGLEITIETPKGERRRPEWPMLAAHYGYIKRTVGNDGDHVDVFVGPNLDSHLVVVVDQVGKDGEFDEHKCLLAFVNATEAIDAYKRCYTPGWKVGKVTTLTIEQFRRWLSEGKQDKPIYGQVSRYSVSEVVTGNYGDRGRFVTTDDGNRIFITEAGTINRTGQPIDGSRAKSPVDRLQPGQTVQVPQSHTFGEFEAELTDEGDGVLGLRMAGSQNGPLVKMLASRMQQLMDDLSGRVPLQAKSGNPSIDAVGSGRAKFLGRGNDGLAFDTGDGNVVKVSSLFAYHWTAPHRSEEGAVNHTKRGYEIGKKLREAGVPGIVPQEYTEHEGRAFLTMPKLDTEAKITPEHVMQVQRTIKGILDAGYSLFDEIQVGIGQDGNAYIFDLGQAGALRSKDDRDDAEGAIRRFAKEHGVEIENSDPQAAVNEAMIKGREHIEKWEERGAAPPGLRKIIADQMERKFRLAVEDDPDQHDWWIDELTELMNRLNAIPDWKPKERNSASVASQYSSHGYQGGYQPMNDSFAKLRSAFNQASGGIGRTEQLAIQERFSAAFDAVADRYAAQHSERYAARGPKNSPGQMSLFGGDQPLRSSKVQQKFRWITVHPPGHEKGQPVLIDDNGTIKGGMGGEFTGKKLSDLGKKGAGKASRKTTGKGGEKAKLGSEAPQPGGQEIKQDEPPRRKRDDSPEAKVLGKRAGDAKVLGATLFEALEDHRAVTIVGQTVKSRDDLASLAQVYRDPRYETLRAFFVDAKGQIVGHNAYSMRHPAMVAFPQEAVESLERDMVASGAVGFYMLHNHPSGNPEPSTPDLRMQRYLGERFGNRSLGHVVINHNRYAVIDNAGVPEVKDLPKPNENLTDPSKVRVPHEYIGQEINSTDALAGLAAKVRPEKDRAVMVFCNVKGKVTMLLDISADSMRLPDYKVLGAIRRAARATGSERRFLVMPEGMEPKEARVWIRRGIVMDAVESGTWTTEREKGASAGADPIEERAMSNPRTKNAILRERMA